MVIRSVGFVKSSSSLNECPVTELPEYAFIGRSNVGKSSLINMLVNRKQLARTSVKPGKTQLINHFLINESWFLVDLPGYGYAKTSKSNRKSWGNMIENYIIKRENLVNVFLLIDSRLEPQKIDLEFIEWLGINQVPFAIAFTKCDKLSKNELYNNIKKLKVALLNSWEELPMLFLTSAQNHTGRDELLQFIETCNDEYNKKL